MHYTVYEWVKKDFTVDLVTKLALHITSKNKMKSRGDEDSLDETDLYYSFWSMIADFNEIKIALDWSSSEILDILDYTNSIILSSLHVALAPVIQRSEGWKDRAVIVQFSKLRHHLASWCQPLSCSHHMSHVTSVWHSSGPMSSAWCSQILTLPSITATNICLHCQDL